MKALLFAAILFNTDTVPENLLYEYNYYTCYHAKNVYTKSYVDVRNEDGYAVLWIYFGKHVIEAFQVQSWYKDKHWVYIRMIDVIGRTSVIKIGENKAVWIRPGSGEEITLYNIFQPPLG